MAEMPKIRVRTMGKRLQRARRERGLSGNKLAGRVKIAATVLRNYEVLPDRIPRADILLRLSWELGVTMEWLLTGEGDPCRPGAAPFASTTLTAPAAAA